MDEGIRNLERANRQGNDPAWVRLANAYLRAQRYDEALATLLPERHDPVARSLLGSLPAWTDDFGGPGHSRFIDTAPLESPPTVRWTQSVRRRTRGAGGAVLLVSPVAVVCGSGREASALDPDTGEPHFSLPCTRTYGRDLFVIKDVLVSVWARSRRVTVHDLLDGHVLHEWHDKTRRACLATRGFFSSTRRGKLFVHEWTSPHAAPEKEALWTFELPDDPDAPSSIVLGGGLMLVDVHFHVEERGRGGREVVALEARTGRLLWRTFGAWPICDAHGALFSHTTGEAALQHRWPAGLFDLSGNLVWSVERGDCLALAPSYVVFSGERGKHGWSLHVVNRQSGSVVSVIDHRHPYWVAAARDVIYVTTHRPNEILAVRADGTRLWTYEHKLPPGDFTARVVPFNRRLYLLSNLGRVCCLE